MRDPDLMQRADRAAIALEQAWERWRAMHGLGGEPLPPVSSYVGYSHEEPWGQPRVVFGLRSDEAELLVSLLDGHDCAGSVYPDVDRDWRLPVNGPVSIPARGYGGPLSVPAQAPPPRVDLLPPASADEFAGGSPVGEDSPPADEPDDEGQRSRPIRGTGGVRPARSRTGRGGRTARAGGRPADPVDTPADGDEPGWSATDGNPSLAEPGADEADGVTSLSQAPPLAPLPEMPDSGERSDDALSDEPDLLAPPVAKPRGPGNRGPRYQGFPPRYEDGSSADQEPAPERSTVAGEDDEDDVEVGAPSPPVRRTHVSKLSRSARRRAQSS